MELDPHLREVWLRAEISNFNLHSRGHMYLTLKDNQSRVQAVMFARSNRNLAFMPKNGMNVLVKGSIGVFEAYGQYQLYISDMQPDGIGSLYLAYEQLKEKLQKEGLFFPEHKKPIPRFPEKIGIITSPTGAAIRDVLTTIKRRYPIVATTVIPVLVQGEQSVQSVCQGIQYANSQGHFDLLIVGRGGGSIEDLWSFNDEAVVQAIFTSKIPVISAVGHETDTTLSDLVADLRAPTPTAAAELSVPNQSDLLDRLKKDERRMSLVLTQQIETYQRLIKRLQSAYAFRYPEQLIAQKEQELDKLNDRMNQALQMTVDQKDKIYRQFVERMRFSHIAQKFKQNQDTLKAHNERLNTIFNQITESHMKRLDVAMTKLELLNPLHIMKRGFAIPYKKADEIIYSIQDIKEEDEITVQLSDGKIHCTVTGREEDHYD